MKRLKDYYSVKSASKATGIKYKALLQRIARGKVEAVEFNSIKLIPTAEVERLKRERSSC